MAIAVTRLDTLSEGRHPSYLYDGGRYNGLP